MDFLLPLSQAVAQSLPRTSSVFQKLETTFGSHYAYSSVSHENSSLSFVSKKNAVEKGEDGGTGGREKSRFNPNHFHYAKRWLCGMWHLWGFTSIKCKAPDFQSTRGNRNRFPSHSSFFSRFISNNNPIPPQPHPKFSRCREVRQQKIAFGSVIPLILIPIIEHGQTGTDLWKNDVPFKDFK